jgi:magnesium-transporting ATPase (P-type)
MYTVAVATRPSPYSDLTKLKAVQMRMELIGYLTIHDTVPLSLVRYAEKCRRGELRLAVLTDRDADAKYLAKEAGILKEEDLYFAADSPSFSSWLSPDSPMKNALIQCRGSEDRAHAVKRIKAERNKTTVCVIDTLEDLDALSNADVRAAAYRSDARTPTVLSRRADVLIGWNEEGKWTHNAPACGVLQMIGYARSALLNVRAASEYLLLSQTMRLMLLLTAVLTGAPLLSPLPLLLWGLLLDFAAVLSFAFRRPQLGILTVSRSQTALLHTLTDFLFPLAAGTLSGVVLIALFAAAPYLGWSGDPQQLRAVFWVGGILTSFAASV